MGSSGKNLSRYYIWLQSNILIDRLEASEYVLYPGLLPSAKEQFEDPNSSVRPLFIEGAMKWFRRYLFSQPVTWENIRVSHTLGTMRSVIEFPNLVKKRSVACTFSWIESVLIRHWQVWLRLHERPVSASWSHIAEHACPAAVVVVVHFKMQPGRKKRASSTQPMNDSCTRLLWIDADMDLTLTSLSGTPGSSTTYEKCWTKFSITSFAPSRTPFALLIIVAYKSISVTVWFG